LCPTGGGENRDQGRLTELAPRYVAGGRCKGRLSGTPAGHRVAYTRMPGI
jgi:hypothetical protein